MRRFIRHPSHIPIEVESATTGGTQHDRLHDVSENGVSFDAPEPFAPGTLLNLRIPLISPPFETSARVAWCQARGEQFEVGVSLLSTEDAFRTRMVEQLCYIEHYRRQVLRREGRRLTDEEAAMEWIELFAGDFPPPQPHGT